MLTLIEELNKGKWHLINHIVQTSNPYKNEGSNIDVTRTIYYGEVISIDDPTDGGRIKVKIPDLDNKTANENLPWCYPYITKIFSYLSTSW